MSMGPLGGVVGSAAGAPLSQTQGASTERAKQDAATQERGVEADLKTERAEGIGQTEEDQGASERDADGRKLWERAPKKQQEEEEPTDGEADGAADGPPSDETGGRIDLIG